MSSWHIRLRSALIGSIAFFGALMTNSPAEAQQVPRQTRGFLYGAGLHFALYGGSPSQGGELLRRGGFNSFRDEIFWIKTEKDDGTLEIWAKHAPVDQLFLSKASGVARHPVVILDYGHPKYDMGGYPVSDEGRAAFSRYAAFIAKRYADIEPIFEIWNEWNGGMGAAKGAPKMTQAQSGEAYARLLEKAVPAIRAAVPNAIISGGVTVGHDRSWTSSFLKAGGLKWIDAFSIHPYVFDLRHTDSYRPEDAMNRVDGLRKQLREADPTRVVPLYLTEIGWAVGEGIKAYSADVQAHYFVRFMALAKSEPDIRGVWWYELRDSGKDEKNIEHRFGVFEHEPPYRSKPAALVAKRIAPYMIDGELSAAKHREDGVQLRVFRRSESDYLSIIWATRDSRAVSASSDCELVLEPFAVAGQESVKLGKAATSISVTEAPLLAQGSCGVAME